MTAPDPWGTEANPGQRARAAVGVVAAVALIAAIAGVVFALRAGGDCLSAGHAVGGGLVATALVGAAGCLWHGSRNAHERGRNVAIAAVLVALVGVVTVAGPVASRVRGPGCGQNHIPGR